MSLVAGRTVTSSEDVPDTDDGGEKVTAGTFWPEIALSDVRMEMRINGAVTTSRLKQAVIEGYLTPSISSLTGRPLSWQRLHPTGRRRRSRLTTRA
jgi:hypothetical protein